MDIIVLHKKQKGQATSFNNIRELALPHNYNDIIKKYIVNMLNKILNLFVMFIIFQISFGISSIWVIVDCNSADDPCVP
jgi:hypothetical protein